jgi:hypothetical protein
VLQFVKPQAAKWAGIIEFAAFVSAFCAIEMRAFGSGMQN